MVSDSAAQNPAHGAQLPADLAAVVTAWPTLAPALRAAVLALVKTAGAEEVHL